MSSDNLLIDDRDSFAEILGIQIDLLQYLSGFELLLAQPGAALEPRAFVQKSRAILQTFGESIGIVRVGVDYLIAIFRRLRGNA